MFWRRKRERELQREIEAHLELEAEEQGGDALAARKALGNRALVQEDARAAWGWTWLEHLAQDLRYAGRVLRKNPGFAATAAVSLALGIGANTAIFSLIDALMLRWLPVREPQELVQVFMTPRGAQESLNSASLSYPVVKVLTDQRDIFTGVGGFSTFPFNTGLAETVRRTPGAYVTGAFYEMLGLEPAAGRLLTREDDQPGAPLVAVISHGYWERAFARDPRVIGEPYRINGQSVVLVGVGPPGFTGTDVGWIADITLPVAVIPQIMPEQAGLLGPGNIWLRTLARPRPGVSPAQARDRLAALWPGLSPGAIGPEWPAERKQGVENAVFTLRPGATGWTILRDMFQKPLAVLMGLVGLVLLIACANVAGLMLARAAARQREIAVRFAMGAGRGRIMRQLLTESLLLSLAGAALGIWIAWFLSDLLMKLLSTGPMQVALDLTPNGHVLAFASVLAVVTAILFGLAPAWQATAHGPSAVMKDAARKIGFRARLLPSVVTAQVALSLLLLVGAGLFVRTLANLRNLDAGFTHEGVLVADLSGERDNAFYQASLEAIRRIPSVLSASVSTNTPLSGAGWSETVTIRGEVQQREPAFLAVSPGYFETLRTPILRGRDFMATDNAPPANVAIVNETFAGRYFPNQNPLGEHFLATVQRPAVDLQIVGVVKDAVANRLRLGAPATVFVAHSQVRVTVKNFSKLEVRAVGSLAQVSEAVRGELQARMPGVPVEIHSLTAQVEAAIVQERLMATLASGFGILALTLAAVGLYGLLAYGVAARTKEIGIRMALGARQGRVLRGVLLDATRLLAIGVAVGLPSSWGAARFVESMLFGLEPTDAATLAGSIGVLAFAALLAAYLPARRASRVDPMTALRHE